MVCHSRADVPGSHDFRNCRPLSAAVAEIGSLGGARARKPTNKMKTTYFRDRFQKGIVLILFAAMATAKIKGAAIDDASFFTGLPHSLITFETDGTGAAVDLGEGIIQLLPGNEYAAQGISFTPAIHWVNDGGSAFDAAQAIGGSGKNAIFSTSDLTFRLNFVTPVYAFGFWVIHNNTAASAPTFIARDSNGLVIDSATFGPLFRDGTVGVADYGFMGIVAANKGIASVDITTAASEFDNLYFSPVPEPTALSLLGLAGLSGVVCGRIQRRDKKT